MLLVTWQLIVRSHRIVVLLFYDLTPPTRLSNNPPGCQQLLLNLASVLLWYPPNSVRSLVISERNRPNRLLSLGNLPMLFKNLQALSATFTVVFGFSAISWSFVFFTTVFACSDQLITSLLEFFCIVQAWFPFTSSGNRVVSSAVLTIYKTVQVVPSNYLSFLLLLRNSECRVLPLLLRPVIWLDSGFFEIFRLLASRSRFTCISWTANNQRSTPDIIQRIFAGHSLRNTLRPHTTPNILSPLGPMFKMVTIWETHLPPLESLKR